MDGVPRAISAAQNPCVPPARLLCPAGARLGARWAAAVLLAGMCHSTAASPTGPRASLTALRELRYEDEMQCLEKSSRKLAKGGWWRCFPHTRHGTSAHGMAQRGRACTHSRVPGPDCRNHPCPPCSPFASQQGRRRRVKKFALWAGRRAHTPCFAKCIRSIPATNRLAGALSGTREGRAM